MARKSNTEARRAEITGALLTVIARHGYDKATIQAIAKQAGLAPGLAAGLAAMIEGAYQLSSAAPDVMPRGYAVDAATAYAELRIAAAPPVPASRQIRARKFLKLFPIVSLAVLASSVD